MIKLTRISLFLILAMALGIGSTQATQVQGGNAGDGGDTSPATFHFDSQNLNFQMTMPDGTPLVTAQMTYEYGRSFVIYENNQNYITGTNLAVIGASLTGNNLLAYNFPPENTVAIDPNTGRFKFSQLSTWQPAQSIDNGRAWTFTNQLPDLAMNDKGQAIAVWEQTDAFTVRIYAAHYSREAGWYQMATISANSAQAALHPRVAMNDSGQALCVFQQSDGTHLRIYGNYYDPSIGWYQAVTLDTGTADSPVYSDVALNDSGLGFAVFTTPDATTNRVYAAQFLSSIGWYQAVTIQPFTLTTPSTNPRVAINSAGMAFCVFEQMYATPGIAANYFTPTTGWQGAVRIDNQTPNPAYNPRIVMNETRALCSFVQPDATHVRAYVNEYVSNWQTTPTLVDDLNQSNSLSLTTSVELAMNNSGQAAVVFNQPDAATIRVYANRYSPGVGWYGAVTIDVKDSVPAYNPKVAMNDNGQILCAFAHPLGPFIRLYVNQYIPDSGWQAARINSRDDMQAVDYAGDSFWDVCLNNAGEGFTLFYQVTVAGMNRVMTSHFENWVPYGKLQVNYNYQATTPTPTPMVVDQNRLEITNRKIQPLHGEKVKIQYALKDGGKVSIKIYSLRGELVAVLADQYQAAGLYELQWGAETTTNALAASGVYIIHIQTPSDTKNQKVVVIK